MYTVSLHHHCKNWRNGDLEDKTELVETLNFKTKKAAKEYVRNKMHIKHNTFGGEKKDYWGWYTGVKWVHENTGEDMEEYYMYKIDKTIVH